MLDRYPRRRSAVFCIRLVCSLRLSSLVMALAVSAACEAGCGSRGLSAARLDGASPTGGAEQTVDGDTANGGSTGSVGKDSAAMAESGAGAEDGRAVGAEGAAGAAGGASDGPGLGGAGETGSLVEPHPEDAAAGSIDVAGGVGGGTGGTGGTFDAAGGQGGNPDVGPVGWRGIDTGRPGQLTTDPTVVEFGVVEMGATRTAVVTAFNSGVTPIAVSGTMYNQAFTTADWGCPFFLEPGAACQVTLKFSPVALGTAVTDFIIGDTFVTLIGVAIEAATFTATGRVELGTVVVGQPLPVVVEIVPDAPLSRLGCVAGGGDLKLVSQTCPEVGVVVEPCSFTYTFEATQPGARSDAVICTGPGGNTTATLVSAVAMPRPSVAVAPSPATFTAAPGAGATATLTVVSTSDTACTDLTVVLTIGSEDFAIVETDCKPGLPAHATCTVKVAFSPTTLARKMGAIFASCGSMSAVVQLIGTVEN